MNRAEALKYRKSIEDVAALQSDEKALENIYLYPKWEADIDVAKDDRYRDGDTLYKCVQAHRTQQDWPPHLTPALWAVVSLDEWPEWVQPTGAQDAYNTGDKVHYPDADGPVYVSTLDGNVWAPGVYGWELV
jgi:hypothetical protein